jgi:hypothetical protein
VGARLPWEPLPATDPEPKGSDPLPALVYRGAVRGADAYRGVRLALRRDQGVLRVGNRFVADGRYREVAFVAAGRCANSMALAVLGVLGDRVTQGFVATPEPVAPELPFRGVEVPAGWGGAAAAAEIVQAAQEIAASLRESDLLLLLLSPGALRALQLPPPGMGPEDFSNWLRSAHERGATGREVERLARVLGRGGVGGRLLPSTTVADVETWVVDRGSGATLLGGGPTRPVRPDERVEARAVAERVGVAGALPLAARAGFEPAAGDGLALPPHARPPVVVAGPPDALRGAADAASDKGWTSRLAFLELPEPPEAAAAKFVDRTDELLRSEGPGAAQRGKGLVAFAMSTLNLPEGVDEAPARERFLAAALPRLRRREMGVGIFSTAGPSATPDGPGGAVIGAGAVAAPTGAGGAPRPVAMRRGITDVGLLAVGLWAAPPESGGGGR